MQPPEKVTATVFCDVYRVLLVDFIPHGPTINAAAYHEALKRLKEAIWQTDKDVDHNSSSFASASQY